MIHHYSSFIDGGAGGAAIRLHQSLSSIGVQSRFVYSRTRNESKQKQHLDDSHVEASWKPASRLSKISNSIAYRLKQQAFKFATYGQPSGHDLFTSTNGPELTKIDPATHQVGDLLHLHWINKFIDWQQFFYSVPAGMPIVWTLHDMNPITGGCHFSGGCERFKSQCGDCFQLRRPKLNDISHRILSNKTRALIDRKIHVVAPSLWLVNQARESAIMKGATSFRRIPLSINADDFQPIPRDTACRAIGIDPEHFVIAFGAMGIDNARKGARHLIDSLSSLANIPNVHLVTFGNGRLPVGDRAMPPMTQLGLLHDKQMLRKAYAAANVFVLPSLEDNFPLTGLEAMACGTPVVAFDAGGIPDYVRERQTGLLAKTGSTENLTTRLRWAIDHVQDIASMGLNARNVIETEYAAPIEAMAYRDLYDELLDDQSSRLQRAA